MLIEEDQKNYQHASSTIHITIKCTMWGTFIFKIHATSPKSSLIYYPPSCSTVYNVKKSQQMAMNLPDLAKFLDIWTIGHARFCKCNLQLLTLIIVSRFCAYKWDRFKFSLESDQKKIDSNFYFRLC